MGNKILYRNIDGKQKFYGMVNVPQEPSRSVFFYGQALDVYEAQIEACKASALEIINPEVLPIVYGTEMSVCTYLDGKGARPLQDGDIFDCPEGLEFEEDQDYCDHPACRRDSDCANCPTPVKLIRLVKTSKEESQEELSFDGYLKLLGVDHTHAIAVQIWDCFQLHNYSIQRKKPTWRSQ